MVDWDILTTTVFSCTGQEGVGDCTLELCFQSLPMLQELYPRRHLTPSVLLACCWWRLQATQSFNLCSSDKTGMGCSL